MSIEIYFEIFTNKKIEEISLFLQNKIYIYDKNYIVEELSHNQKKIISFRNNYVNILIAEQNKQINKFHFLDYKVNVNTLITFRKYPNSQVNSSVNIIIFVLKFLKSFSCDCLLMPNGDYVALLRRNNELFIDTSKSIFNNFDFSLIDIPYTDTILDDDFFK